MGFKYIYFFNEGSSEMKELLGNKGAHLCNMKTLGVNVPEGFIISTEASRQYAKNPENFLDELMREVHLGIKYLEKLSGKIFGDTKNPMLISVRSGASISMPGMMDTILNLGINASNVESIAEQFKDKYFAYDTYARFLKMFGEVVLGICHDEFNSVYDEYSTSSEYKFSIVEKSKKLERLLWSVTNFSEDVNVQLRSAIEAVFNSWNNDRAVTYRKLNNISDNLGTAVVIQLMVFGNLGSNSGTGIIFSRNPSTGANEIYGEFLESAQGESLVDGSITPLPINEIATKMPKVFDKLINTAKLLENYYKDVQDIEFTIESEKLFFLQTRSAKRTPNAAIKIATDLVMEGKIAEKDAILRIDPKILDTVMYSTFKCVDAVKVIARGLPASPGAVSGKICFCSEQVKKNSLMGNKVILVRTETSPEDISGIAHAEGILTERGGMTSHAAVVARGMGKCCITGSRDIFIDYFEKKIITKEGIVINEGDEISLDGNVGIVYLGSLESECCEMQEEFKTLLKWSSAYKKLGVMANADSPDAVKKSLAYGAEGVGLCRTEHMFFGKERIAAFREMILSRTLEGRCIALEKLLYVQIKDFKEMYNMLDGLPITIRLLDPPMHEFLPKTEEEIIKVSSEMKIAVDNLKPVVESFYELNPMLGFRGCRLYITYPEIAIMQTRAIIEAAVQSYKETNIVPSIEVMIPFICDVEELKFIRNIVKKVADEILEKERLHNKIFYKIGTMIEIPRAALLAHELAEVADFFSFGTNDLTQMTFGFSRDDIGKFLPNYLDNKILKSDPFVTIDTKAVGALVEIALKKGREANATLKCGICGEHGGDSDSITYFNSLGLDYISCSPHRIMIAKISAARAAIMENKKAAEKILLFNGA